jgi:hypothetical protein
MRVTVMSPVTAMVTVSQVVSWLERGGWGFKKRTGDFEWWQKDDLGVPLVVSTAIGSDVPELLASAIEIIAEQIGETPAYVLQEMADVKL